MLGSVLLSGPGTVRPPSSVGDLTSGHHAPGERLEETGAARMSEKFGEPHAPPNAARLHCYPSIVQRLPAFQKYERESSLLPNIARNLSFGLETLKE